MAPTLSPTAWRRWLALELRRLREEAGLSQKQVAQKLRCNVSKVSYIENAQRPVVPRDLNEILLPLYNVPEEEWGRYLDAARDSRKPRWWEAYPEGGALAASADLYVGLEQGATRHRAYHPLLVPGLLQVPDYTRATLDRSVDWDRGNTESALELRTRRQVVLTRSSDPLRLWVILDEAAVRRQVGSRDTMRAQISHLIEASRLPNITLQILPFSLGAHHGMTGGFTILEFSWPEVLDRGMVYLENLGPMAQYIEERTEVDAYISAFEQLSVLGAGPDTTVSTLEAIAKENS